MLLNDKIIFAVDYDGTLCLDKYEETSVNMNTRLIHFLKTAQKDGNIVILNTCRHDADLIEARNACEKEGLIFDYINENVPELIEKFGDCRKIAADIYIDDKALDMMTILKGFDAAVEQIRKNIGTQTEE